MNGGSDERSVIKIHHVDDELLEALNWPAVSDSRFVATNGRFTVRERLVLHVRTFVMFLNHFGSRVWCN